MSTAGRRLALLTERWLDGELDAAGRDELLALLQAEPAARHFLLAQARLDGLVREVHLADGFAHATVARWAHGTGTVSRRGVAVQRRRRQRRPLIALALAAGILAAVAVVVLATRPEPPAVMVAQAVSGSSVVRAGNRLAARPGVALRGGDSLMVPEGGTLRLEYGDGSAVVVAGPGEFALGRSGGGKQLRLERGRFTAEVAPQPAGAPMTIATPQALATIVGTRLTLSASGDATRLQVDEGLVRLARCADAAAVDVAAGEEATAAGGAPLVAQAQPRLPGRLVDDHESGLRWRSAVPHSDPVALALSAAHASRGLHALRVAYAGGGTHGTGAVLHPLEVQPGEDWLCCRVLVVSGDDGTVVDLQAVTRDGGSWYLGYAEVAGRRGEWFTLMVPIRTPRKKNSPSGGPHYRPEDVVACSLGITYGAATVFIDDLTIAGEPPASDGSTTP